VTTDLFTDPAGAAHEAAAELANRTGVDAHDAAIVLGQWDVISIPINVMRGFRNESDEEAYMLALVGAAFYVATLLVRTIVPLRVIGIISMVFFIAYGALAGAVATFLLYLLSLPINVIRLRQMLTLVKKARLSAQGDLSMDWLRPFMTPRKYKKGDVLFRKGDVAKEMFYTVTGRFLVKEIGIELPPGRIMGELGFIAPKNRRTQTVQSLEDGEVLTITYEKLLELYFQNPEFGYYFLRLTTERLMQNVARLEGIVAQHKEPAAPVVAKG